MTNEIARLYKRGRGKILEWVIKIENYVWDSRLYRV